AARLLLIPVLAGGSAALVARAQYNPVPPGAKAAGTLGMSGPPARTTGGPAAAAAPANPAAPAMPTDPKAMLKEGRKALAAGQFDLAQDLARAADANNPTGKWGLFEDTPAALLKDIQAA